MALLSMPKALLRRSTASLEIEIHLNLPALPPGAE